MIEQENSSSIWWEHPNTGTSVYVSAKVCKNIDEKDSQLTGVDVYVEVNVEQINPENLENFAQFLKTTLNKLASEIEDKLMKIKKENDSQKEIKTEISLLSELIK